MWKLSTDPDNPIGYTLYICVSILLYAKLNSPPESVSFFFCFIETRLIQLDPVYKGKYNLFLTMQYKRLLISRTCCKR